MPQPAYNLSGASVLVTGATGLLGRPLVDALLTRGANVVGAGMESRPVDFPVDAEYWSCDLSRAHAWTGQLDEFEFIFHLAGAKGGVGIGQSSAADFMRGNLLSTINLLNELAALKRDVLKRLLFVSSVGAYPGHLSVFDEAGDIWVGKPHSSDFFGGVAKRTCEALCEAHWEQYGLNYVVVRPTNCFGPFDRFDAKTGMVIAALIARIEFGENPLVVWGDGSARRDFLYSVDAAEQMIVAMERGGTGEAYNLGTGYAISIDEVVGHLSKIYPGQKFRYDCMGPSGPNVRLMDMRKLFSLSVNLRNTHMQFALEQTINWYRANKNYAKYDPFKK